MDRRRFLQTAAASGAVAWTVPTIAGVTSATAGTVQPCSDGAEIFADNFDDERCTSPSTTGVCFNYTAFDHWDVVDGAVDTIEHGTYGSCNTGEGRAVDLTGSFGQPNGKLTKKKGIFVVAGRSYLLAFSQGSNGNGNTTRVTFGSEQVDIPAPTAGTCATRSVVLVPGATGDVELSFLELASADDQSGSIIDDVVVREYCDESGAGAAAAL